MGGNFCQILELGGTTIKGRRVGPTLAEKLESKNDDDPLIKINAQTKQLKFKLIDNTYVLNAISRLKNGKAPGPDKISTRLVKDSGGFIWKSLTMIYNSSLKTGVFLAIWKLASVTPILKTGPKMMQTITDRSP